MYKGQDRTGWQRPEFTSQPCHESWQVMRPLWALVPRWNSGIILIRSHCPSELRKGKGHPHPHFPRTVGPSQPGLLERLGVAGDCTPWPVTRPRLSPQLSPQMRPPSRQPPALPYGRPQDQLGNAAGHRSRAVPLSLGLSPFLLHSGWQWLDGRAPGGSCTPSAPAYLLGVFFPRWGF